MKEIDYSELYGQRVLVFLENAPQSNKYHQILLTPKECDFFITPKKMRELAPTRKQLKARREAK